MPVYESYTSRSGDGRQIQRQYSCLEYTTEALAITAVHATAPSSIGDLERVDDDTRVVEIAEEKWQATVTWRLVEPSSGLNYSFTIGGNSFFREFPISQTGYWSGVSWSADDVGINYDGEKVNGVTLPPRPGFEFTIERRKTVADVDTAYVTAVSDLLFTVNDASFEGFAAGEVIFLGLTGSRVGESEWTLYYKFGRSKNETGLSVDTITGINKEGWEYLWVLYLPEEDATRKYLATKPYAAYVAQVFEDGDFTDLEL